MAVSHLKTTGVDLKFFTTKEKKNNYRYKMGEKVYRINLD